MSDSGDNKASNPYKQNENQSLLGYDNRTLRTKPLDVVYMRRLVVTELPIRSLLTDEIIEVRKIPIIRTPCSNPAYLNDVSFKTRYAYDTVIFTHNKPPKQALPVYYNTDPKFTPWRERFEMGFPDPMASSESNILMEDTEPHYLLQEQAGYLGSGPAPYPRSWYRLLFPSSKAEKKPIVIPMDFLNDPLRNIEACLRDESKRCEYEFN